MDEKDLSHYLLTSPMIVGESLLHFLKRCLLKYTPYRVHQHSQFRCLSKS